MVQIDYRLFGTGWCMVDALVYGTGLLQVKVQFDAWLRFIGTGLQRYIPQSQCESSSIIVLLLKGGWMGQGQVVVATFRL